MNAPKRKRQRKRDLVVIHPHAAGIDVGSKFHVVAVPSSCDPEPVRSFRSFTGDLHHLADWLQQVGITSVAMESTSVYWIPVFEILEERGFEVILVNARDAKQVPGRKTDFNDAQWLQQLHEYGLLRASFRPRQQIVALRSYVRQRERLLEFCAAQIQHMQKALMEMNLQLHHVVTDITGESGMKIIRAIVAGQRDPQELAAYRDPRCRQTSEVLREALEGNYQDEHVFELTQAVQLYDFCKQRIVDCDAKIEANLRTLCPGDKLPVENPGAVRIKNKRHNGFSFDVQPVLHTVLGLDVTKIDGFGPHVALKLLAECGTDMSRWPSAKHFTSWLCLSPGNKISGGKVLSSRTRRSSSRAAAALRLAATTVGRTQTALGAFYRRLSGRIGKAKAVTATARKLAVLFYNTLRYGMNYADPGATYYEERYRQRLLENLRRRAQDLGYVLQESPAGAS